VLSRQCWTAQVTVVHADAGNGIVDPLSLKLAQEGDGWLATHAMIFGH